jgi:hypothetical protein
MSEADELWAFIVDIRSGAVMHKGLPFSNLPRTGKRINTEGPLQITVPMSATFNRDEMTPFLNPWRYAIGVAFGAEIIQCGPITDYPEYDPDGEDWSFDCGGLLLLFNKKRFLVFSRDYRGLSRHDVVVQLLTDDLAQINGDLPMDLPALNGAGGVGGFFPWGKFTAVGEVIKDQTDDVDGVEVDFRPYFTDGHKRDHVRWRVDIGAPYLGRQDRAHEWVANKTLVSAQPFGGGARIADLYIVPGQSSGDVFLFGVADPAYNASIALAAQGWPLLMDLDTTHTSIADQATLTGFADGNFTAFHNGYRMVKARVRLNPRQGDGPRLAEWNLGDLARFQVRGYIGLPDGVYYCRIVGAELVTLEELELELQLVSEVLS